MKNIIFGTWIVVMLGYGLATAESLDQKKSKLDYYSEHKEEFRFCENNYKELSGKISSSRFEQRDFCLNYIYEK